MTKIIPTTSKKEATARLKYLRVAPKKARRVADVVRGMPVQEAEAQLLLLPKRTSIHLLKLLRSAVAGAQHNHKLKSEELYVKEIRVDQGPRLKRWRPRARGVVSLIEKKMSHITITLGVRDEVQPRFVMPAKIVKKATEVKKKKREIQREKKRDEEIPRPEVAQEPKPKQSPGGTLRKLFRRKSV